MNQSVIDALKEMRFSAMAAEFERQFAFCGAERPLVRRPTATRRCNGRSQLECWNWQAV